MLLSKRQREVSNAFVSIHRLQHTSHNWAVQVQSFRVSSTSDALQGQTHLLVLMALHQIKLNQVSSLFEDQGPATRQSVCQ